jgi:hypothetical protein
MDEIDILRLNVDRYRHLLHTEMENSQRLTVEKLLHEFETKLLSTLVQSSQHRNSIETKA